MNSLTELYNRLDEYYNLRSSITSIISFFDKAIDSIEGATAFQTYYSIDDISADMNKIVSAKEKLKNKKSNLTSEIIPSIDSQINHIKNEIEEELERRRRVTIVKSKSSNLMN